VPSADPSRTPDQNSRTPDARAAGAISLAVAAQDTPIAGRFFQDVGKYGFSGRVTTGGSGERVEIWYYSSGGSWKRILTTTSGAEGRWKISKSVTVAGQRRFIATRGGSPTKSSTVKSREVRVTVENSYVAMDAPPSSIDALKSATITGRVFPARRVTIHFQVKSGKDFHTKAKVRSNSSGRWSVKFSTGTGRVHRYSLRARDWVDGSVQWETSSTRTIRRAKVLNPQTRPTTTADVAKTYRAGCPVGPSKLTTISMNYWGFDKRMHRGVIIVRDDMATKVIRSFREALDAGYPITRMDNPNRWDGNDPTMMAADNTSGFNCRKVVGNPYAQSPHSYGTAIDVNTVRNPYRDANGVWWPKNGRKYIDRTPWKPGMLTKSSRLTRSLENRGYFWGGRWYPGRDYQHYQHDR
jgi:hypothetical protein